MGKYYIYSEDRLLDEIFAKNRENARKIFVEKQQEANADAEILKIRVATKRRDEAPKRSTFHISPKLYEIVAECSRKESLPIQKYISKVTDDLISGEYDYAFDFTEKKEYRSVAVYRSDVEKLKKYANKKQVNLANLLEVYHAKHFLLTEEASQKDYLELSNKLSKAIKELEYIKSELDVSLKKKGGDINADYTN